MKNFLEFSYLLKITYFTQKEPICQVLFVFSAAWNPATQPVTKAQVTL